MKFDLTKPLIVYPSWAHFSYNWNDLPTLLADPLETKYLRRYSYKWEEMGYSMVMDNFMLIDGPFGNGIVRYDAARMADSKRQNAWLPQILLNSEAYATAPPGIGPIKSDKFEVTYLSPKPSDEVKLGFERRKKDPLPYFSIEPCDGLDGAAFVCACTSQVKKIPEELLQLPIYLSAFGFKSELLDADLPEKEIQLIAPFSTKWNLAQFWFFVDLKGLDCGVLLAALVYLGGHFRQNNPKLKSLHIITSLEAGYEPMCSHWTMQKLR